MATTSYIQPRQTDVRLPAAAALLGALVFGATMTAGYLFDLQDSDLGPSTSDIVAYVVMPLAAAGIAVWLGTRAWAGTPQRLARTALGLGIASAVTCVAFWSGWPHVFGAVAVLLALEHRRRVGSLSASAWTGLGLGALALVVAAYTCVTG